MNYETVESAAKYADWLMACDNRTPEAAVRIAAYVYRVPAGAVSAMQWRMLMAACANDPSLAENI